jgi:phytoene dehydrogenase-like protein
MTDYDAIVIGAGNGGLAAAAALARGGTRVLVLERHNIPGGCATSFCRGRFEFEVSLHQLSGLGRPDFPGPLRGLLQNLGVLGKLEFVEMENLFRFIVPDRVDVVLPANRAGIVQVLQERFPDEKDGIERFFDLVYRFFQEVISAFYLRDPEVTPEKYPLYFQYAFRDSQSVIDEYFRDPYLKLTVAGYWGYMGLPPRLLAFSDLAALLFAYIEFKPWHLKGGSQAFPTPMGRAVLDAGGEIRFSCGAERIVTRDGAVRAVVTDRGEEITPLRRLQRLRGGHPSPASWTMEKTEGSPERGSGGRWWVLHFSRFTTRSPLPPRSGVHLGDDQLHLHLHRHGPGLRPLPDPRRERTAAHHELLRCLGSGILAGGNLPGRHRDDEVRRAVAPGAA